MTDENRMEQYTRPAATQQEQIHLRLGQLVATETVDRRLRNRYPVRLEVEYMILNFGQVVRRGNGTTVNISSHGILFQTNDALPTGRSIKVVIKWPFSLEGMCALKLHILGTIVRSDPKRTAIRIDRHEFRTVSIRPLLQVPQDSPAFGMRMNYSVNQLDRQTVQVKTGRNRYNETKATLPT